MIFAHRLHALKHAKSRLHQNFDFHKEFFLKHFVLLNCDLGWAMVVCQVVSVLSFFYDDLSSNPAEVKLMLKRTKNCKKRLELPHFLDLGSVVQFKNT